MMTVTSMMMMMMMMIEDSSILMKKGNIWDCARSNSSRVGRIRGTHSTCSGYG